MDVFLERTTELCLSSVKSEIVIWEKYVKIDLIRTSK